MQSGSASQCDGLCAAQGLSGSKGSKGPKGLFATLPSRILKARAARQLDMHAASVRRQASLALSRSRSLFFGPPSSAFKESLHVGGATVSVADRFFLTVVP